MSCTVYSSRNCPKCEVLKRYLTNHNIKHTVRMVEDPEAKVDALMLNIYSTPALVIGEEVLHQNKLFQGERLNEEVLSEFLRRHGLAKTQ